MSKILVTGSLAYDHIMNYPDQFKNHIMEDKAHILSVAFVVDSFHRHYGGTAGNVAYNLTLLDIIPRVLATAGGNFGEYRTYLEERGIDTSDIHVFESEETAQAFIITDRDDNQITAFHPGAMNLAHEVSIKEMIQRTGERPEWVIISANGKDGMLKYGEECRELGISFLFDPGQMIPAFSRLEMVDMLKWSNLLVVNDYEFELIKKETGKDLEDLLQNTEAVIVTKGKEGSVIYNQTGIEKVTSVTPKKVLDPTGCGDAYRAGILYGLINKLPWAKTGRIAALAGAYKIECHGTQNHHYTFPEFKERYEKEFGEHMS